jgi:hypothetical protein
MTEEVATASHRRILQLMAVMPAVPAITAGIAKSRVLSLPDANNEVTPSKVSIPQAALDDLKQRLKATRWPEKETGSDWSQGVPLHKAGALISCWEKRYD